MVKCFLDFALWKKKLLRTDGKQRRKICFRLKESLHFHNYCRYQCNDWQEIEETYDNVDFSGNDQKEPVVFIRLLMINCCNWFVIKMKMTGKLININVNQTLHLYVSLMFCIFHIATHVSNIIEMVRTRFVRIDLILVVLVQCCLWCAALWPLYIIVPIIWPNF